MLRRELILGARFAPLGTAIAACAAPGGGSGGQTVALDQKTANIELWSSPTNNGRKDQVAAWNTKFPNLTVTLGTQFTTTGQGEASFAPIIAAAAAGNPPTVVDFDRFQVAATALKRLWQPLDDFIKRDKYDMNRFAPLIVPEAKGLDGKWYGLIRSTDNRILFWNKEAFQEVGLDPEKPPATWDELRQFAMRLAKRGTGAGGFDRIGLHTQVSNSQFSIRAWQNGGAFQTADGKKATLPDPKNQEALERLVDLTRDLGGWGALEDFRKSWGSAAQDSFLTGQLAMAYRVSGSTFDIARYRPDMKFGVAQPPLRRVGDKPLTWSGGHSYCLSTGAQDADVGWELGKWLISEEGHVVLNDGDLGRAKAAGGLYGAPMTGQPELDKRMIAKYKTGIAAVDTASGIAVSLMPYSRIRDPSIAAQVLWDASIAAQTQAISQDKSAKQALEDNQVLVQRELDTAWANAPK